MRFSCHMLLFGLILPFAAVAVDPPRVQNPYESPQGAREYHESLERHPAWEDLLVASSPEEVLAVNFRGREGRRELQELFLRTAPERLVELPDNAIKAIRDWLELSTLAKYRAEKLIPLGELSTPEMDRLNRVRRFLLRAEFMAAGRQFLSNAPALHDYFPADFKGLVMGTVGGLSTVWGLPYFFPQFVQANPRLWVVAVMVGFVTPAAVSRVRDTFLKRARAEIAAQSLDDVTQHGEMLGSTDWETLITRLARLTKYRRCSEAIAYMNRRVAAAHPEWDADSEP